MEKLLGDAALAEEMRGGAMTIFRLAPQDYHRFHMPVSAKMSLSVPIDGNFFTVNPIAVNHQKVCLLTAATTRALSLWVQGDWMEIDSTLFERDSSLQQRVQ